MNFKQNIRYATQEFMQDHEENFEDRIVFMSTSLFMIIQAKLLSVFLISIACTEYVVY